ncbi:MAG TPA: RDD family protein [Brevibacterium ravenspurgense]|nr:RDD family protein [Brevibacterium ravenspurgense]
MSRLVTGEAISLSIRPASLMARAASCAIDFAIYMVVSIAYFIGLAYLLSNVDTYKGELFAVTIATLASIFMLVGVPCIVEYLTRGRSVGKLIVGLRIVRDDGGALAFRHSLIRALLWPFEILGSGGGVAALVGLFSADTKRLGDHLAGTIAISERAKLPVTRTNPVKPALAAWARSADISPIPAPLQHRAAQFLATAHMHTKESRWARAVEIADELNNYAAPAPPMGTLPEEFIATIVEFQRWDGYRRAQNAQKAKDVFASRMDRLPHGMRLQ